MSHTITKTSLRGFTLIELLVVIAIIGLLSTAIMGPVQTGLKKGRDTRKISDLSQIQGALLQYAGDNNGLYPASLQALAPNYMSIDANMASSSIARNKFMYVIFKDATTDKNTIAYHLGVALENQNASLQTDVDCGEYADASSGIDETKYAGNTSVTSSSTACTKGMTGGSITNPSYSGTALSDAGNPSTSASTDDFGGSGTKENATDVCTAELKTCIFDIIPK